MRQGVRALPTDRQYRCGNSDSVDLIGCTDSAFPHLWKEHTLLKRIAVTIILAALVCALSGGPGSAAKSGGSLELLCAPAMRAAIEDMLASFGKATGVRTQVSYDGSAILLGQLKLRPHGDLFVPADRFYADEAVKDRLAEDPRIYAYLVPVILVQKGNPHKVHKLTDLMQSGIRVGLEDARAGAIGKVTAAVLKKNHIDVAKTNVVFWATKVDELANAIKLKSIDATLVWKPVAMLYTRDADIVGIPGNRNIVAPVSAAIISSSTNKPAARQFLTYLTSRAGKAILAKYHYPTTDPSKVKSH